MTSRTHSKKALPLPKQGEIWLVKFPPTKEDRKPIRPCLVISDKEHLGVLNSKRIGELRKAWQVAFDSESWDW